MKKWFDKRGIGKGFFIAFIIAGVILVLSLIFYKQIWESITSAIGYFRNLRFGR